MKSIGANSVIIVAKTKKSFFLDSTKEPLCDNQREFCMPVSVRLYV